MESEKKGQNLPIGVISSVISIFVFLTGINGLPALFNQENTTGIFNEQISRSFSVGIFIITQVAYYIALYLIFEFTKEKLTTDEDYLNPNDSYYNDWDDIGKNMKRDKVKRTINLYRLNHKMRFMLILVFLLSLGVSFLFMEGYWGSIGYILRNRIGVFIFFLPFSLIFNCFTLWSAFRLRI